MEKTNTSRIITIAEGLKELNHKKQMELFILKETIKIKKQIKIKQKIIFLVLEIK